MKNVSENYMVVAETAFSHEGDFGYLIKQINTAAEGGADYIKFQVFIDKESYYAPGHPALQRIEKMMFTRQEWERIFRYAFEKKLRLIILPLNLESFRFSKQFEELIYGYEIHSVCFNERFLLENMKEISRFIILGIGGRFPQEIDQALRILQKDTDKIILMYGFQSFPTDYKTLNLEKLKYLKNTFGCTIGYADHSAFDDKAFSSYTNYAYILGARWFEKHVVVEPGVKRVDFESAVGAKGLRKLRNDIDHLKETLGNRNIFHLNDAELTYRNRGKKLAAQRDLPAGHILDKEDIGFFVIEEIDGIDQIRYDELLGKRLTCNMKKGEPFRFGSME